MWIKMQTNPNEFVKNTIYTPVQTPNLDLSAIIRL